MSFSYNTSLTTNLDWVRFLIGDTIEATVKLSDEEITAILAEEAVTISGANTNRAVKYFAAASALSALYARWSAAGEGLLEKHVDDLRLIWGTDNKGSVAIEGRIKELRSKGGRLLLDRSILFRSM